MDIYAEELLKILRLEMFNNLMIIALIIVAIIFCGILRKNKSYKILLWLSVAFLFVMSALSVDVLVPIYKDIRSNAFVEAKNVSFLSEDAFDSSGFQQIKFYDESNNCIILKTTKSFQREEFYGTVVYSENSKYLVYCESENE